MIGWQGTNHNFDCPLCDGHLGYQDPIHTGLKVQIYHLECPNCGGALIIRSNPLHSSFIAFGIVSLLILAINFYNMGPALGLYAVLSAALCLLLTVLSVCIRRYKVQSVAEPEASIPQEPLTSSTQASNVKVFRDFGKLLLSRRGPMDSVGRWCFISGVLVIIVCFTGSRYLNVVSTLGWLVQWVGLAILLRRTSSVIISVGGGFLISCIVLFFAINVGQVIGEILSIL